MLTTTRFPTHYEPCHVCGYDHTLDYPRLSTHHRADAEAAHLAAEWEALGDAAIGLEPSDSKEHR
jgi:hypothetical protein